MDKPKTVSRILSQTEAAYLFERFETVHCFKDGVQCPGWDPTLTHFADGAEQTGGCKYKNSHKLCTNLSSAAQGTLILEIRARNEEDSKREAEIERSLANIELKKLKAQKAEIEEAILSYESKIRQQL